MCIRDSQYLNTLQLRGFDSAGILYGCIAGMDAWKDAGFKIDKNSPSWPSPRSWDIANSLLSHLVLRLF